MEIRETREEQVGDERFNGDTVNREVAGNNLAERLGEGVDNEEKYADLGAVAERASVGRQIQCWNEVTEALKEGKSYKEVDERLS